MMSRLDRAYEMVQRHADRGDAVKAREWLNEARRLEKEGVK